MEQAFTPAWGQTQSVNNAAAATTAVILPKNSDGLVLTNTSATARAHVYVTGYLDEDEVPTGIAPTLTTGLPILPSSQIRIRVGMGCKVIRTIATAADGAIILTPGTGI